MCSPCLKNTSVLKLWLQLNIFQFKVIIPGSTIHWTKLANTYECSALVVDTLLQPSYKEAQSSELTRMLYLLLQLFTTENKALWIVNQSHGLPQSLLLINVDTQDYYQHCLCFVFYAKQCGQHSHYTIVLEKGKARELRICSCSHGTETYFFLSDTQRRLRDCAIFVFCKYAS